MMYDYFGDPTNTASPMIWSEIQWTAWLLDGGLALMVVYGGALLVAVREALRIAGHRDVAGQKLYVWGTVLAGYSVGLVALTFNSHPFSGTMGVDFWVLNAAVFTASMQATKAPRGQLA
jgi:hypothetical protein